MAMLSGNVARLFVNGIAFFFDTLDVEEVNDIQRVDNSEGITPQVNPLPAQIGTHVSINGNGCLTVQVNQPSLDLARNPWLVPFSIGAGLFVSLQIFPGGLGGASWYSPTFHIARCGQRINTQTLQPDFFSGESSGAYLRPIS
jgi:hypothetical protein